MPWWVWRIWVELMLNVLQLTSNVLLWVSLVILQQLGACSQVWWDIFMPPCGALHFLVQQYTRVSLLHVYWNIVWCDIQRQLSSSNYDIQASTSLFVIYMYTHVSLAFYMEPNSVYCNVTYHQQFVVLSILAVTDRKIYRVNCSAQNCLLLSGCVCFSYAISFDETPVWLT